MEQMQFAAPALFEIIDQHLQVSASVPHSSDGAQRRRDARSSMRVGRATATLAIAAVLALSATAYARGGTAKPPGGGGGGTPAQPLVSVLPPAGPTLPSLAPGSNGFSITGFVQNATVTGGCPAAPGSTAGGTVTINGVVITIPTNTIVQFPASTLTWANTVCPTQAGVSPIGLDGSGGAGGAATLYPSTEMRVEGNIVAAGGGAGGVGSTHIGALVFASQQSVNTGSGYISFIDFTDGSLYVSTATPAGAGELRLLINDPNGRFGRPQSSPDGRFSVDDINPTIKAAATGYPMCVPRVAPPAAGAPETDPLCPQKNRPVSTAVAPCRNFVAAGRGVPGGGDLVATPAGGRCSAFVMKAVAGMPGTAGLAAAHIAAATDPDPRQQAPFEIGDFITWQGTLVRGGNALPPVAARPTATPDLVWVHTIDANVGIFTQPATLPAYVAVGEFRIGVDPQPTGAAPAGGIETTARLVLEAGTSDVASIIDIYLDDMGPTPSPPARVPERFRWVTMEAMTGTLTDQAALKTPFAISAQPFGGGIQTQFTGPQPGRARIRANKVPAIDPTLGVCPPTGGSQACAVTQSPTRYVRAVLRSLCGPAPDASATGNAGVFPAGTPAGNPGNLDGGPFFDINGGRPNFPGAGPGASGLAAGDGTCLQSAQFANGLFTGQYMAPTLEFIFPENTLAGSPIVPSNFWQMDFLVRGEGGVGGNSAGPQAPTPW